MSETPEQVSNRTATVRGAWHFIYLCGRLKEARATSKDLGVWTAAQAPAKSAVYSLVSRAQSERVGRRAFRLGSPDVAQRWQWMLLTTPGDGSLLWQTTCDVLLEVPCKKHHQTLLSGNMVRSQASREQNKTWSFFCGVKNWLQKCEACVLLVSHFPGTK